MVQVHTTEFKFYFYYQKLTDILYNHTSTWGMDPPPSKKKQKKNTKNYFKKNNQRRIHT